MHEYTRFPTKTRSTTAVRRGLSGTVGGTSFRSIEGAEVAILGKDTVATVSIPDDSGRHTMAARRP